MWLAYNPVSLTNWQCGGKDGGLRTDMECDLSDINTKVMCETESNLDKANIREI